MVVGPQSVRYQRKSKIPRGPWAWKTSTASDGARRKTGKIAEPEGKSLIGKPFQIAAFALCRRWQSSFQGH